MKVVFLHADFQGKQDKPKHHDQRESDLLAELMCESVRRVMPSAELIQLTDESTESVGGCRVIRRKWDHGNPMLFRMEHFAELDGEFLSLDTDCIVQRDVSGVFGLPFDVALTFREGPVPDPKTGVDLAKIMPFNTGVVFTRNNGFWKACINALPKDKNLGWFSDQLSIPKVIHRFDVLKLHSDNFNYTPKLDGENVSSRMIVHYKGRWRKHILNNPIWEEA